MTDVFVKGDMLSFLRKATGISQNNLCSETCSVRKISGVENGNGTISDKLFESLMGKMGYQISAIPNFSSKEEYEISVKLNSVHDLILNFELEKAQDILEEISPNKNLLTRLCLQKWIAFYNMIYVTMGRSSDMVINNLIYALSLSGKTAVPDGPCNLSETSIYILMAIAFILGKKTDRALLLLDKLKKYCPYIIDESGCINNHIYVYYTAIFYLAYNEKGDNEERQLEVAKQYAKRHDDCLGVMILTLAEAKQSLTRNELTEYRKKIYEVIDMAEFMSCPFKSAIYEWISENFAKCEILRIGSFEAVRKSDDIVMDMTALSVNDARDNQYALSDLIRDRRIEKGISASKLANGLCSQSKLSKIELNRQGCDCLLLHSLLQRLDAEDEHFIFYISREDNDIYQLVLRLVYLVDKRLDAICQGEGGVINKSDNIYRQLHLLYQSYRELDDCKKIDILKAAFGCTHAELNFRTITDEYFTDAEWKCIVDIAILYNHIGELDKFNVFYIAISNYIESKPGLSDFKKNYAAEMLYLALMNDHNYYLARYWRKLIIELRPKISYRNYLQSIGINDAKE